MPGSTIPERVEYFAGLIRMAYEDLGTPASERVPGEFQRALWMHKDKNFPEVHAKFVHTKHLVYATELVLGSLDRSGDEAKYRFMAVQSTARMYRIWDEQGMSLAPETTQELVQLARRVIVATVWLARRARSRGEFLYNLTMKLHYHLHIAQKSKLNPRWTSTPLDEDFVGRIGAIIVSTARSFGPSRGVHAIMDMYLRMMLALVQTDFRVKWTVGM